MQVNKNISVSVKRKSLKDFIPLVFAFFGAMIILSFYQNLRLYIDGVLDSFLNKSFFLLLLHHTGFTALTALILSFLFNYLEGRKSSLGYNATLVLLCSLILVEGALIEHYIQNYEVLGYRMFNFTAVLREGYSLLPILSALVATIFLFLWFAKLARSLYTIVSRMYPFTIVLFSLFLATLNSDKKPINENKTQHYLESVVNYVFDFNKYEGANEFPLARDFNPDTTFADQFNLTPKKPDIILLIVDGLGTDFIGQNAKFRGFTPFLTNLTEQSLFWQNHLSNTGESFAAVPTILGSLPFGENGFTNLQNNVHRQTLLSILKENGYTTSFNYGGNSALHGLDRFLDQERVDRILDKKGFGEGYKLQEEDAAGITLGYPDKELFRKWQSINITSDKPRFDVFLTLSTKNPFLIPKLDYYEDIVDRILQDSQMDKRAKKLVKRNKEVFASLLYTDEAIERFLGQYKKQNNTDNTIFIITGSHNLKDVPQENNLGRYKVPLLISGSLVKSPKTIKSLVSHADMAPAFVAMLDSKYEMQLPNKVAWLGENLLHASFFKKGKQIPLFRDHNNIQDYIDENLFVSNAKVFKIDNNLELVKTEDEDKIRTAKNSFKEFKAINKYVTTNNKILPQSEALYAKVTNDFSKAELVWVQSVFNGNNFDNAYETARQLAIDKDWDRALLLSNYILTKIPRHADTEVLKGRIHSWKKDYDTSITVLNEAIRKYPSYPDAYSALLDSYYWANKSDEAQILFRTMTQYNISSPEIDEKLLRAKKQIREKALDKAAKEGNRKPNPAIIANK